MVKRVTLNGLKAYLRDVTKEDKGIGAAVVLAR